MLKVECKKKGCKYKGEKIEDKCPKCGEVLYLTEEWVDFLTEIGYMKSDERTAS